MNRIDSGFETSSLKEETEPHLIPLPGSNTAPTRSRKHKKTSSSSTSTTQAPEMPTSYPMLEKRPSAARRSTTEPRRPSIGSSSEDSTAKSRSRGRGSGPSSRRTSCTLVDPSRPARHYRIKSSQSASSAHRGDIDDVLALHFRSCSLFENPSYYSPQTTPAISGYGGLVKTDTESRQAKPVSAISPQEKADYTGYDIPSDIHDTTIVDARQVDETLIPPERANTTMHWMSPSTRQRQYEKIDRANSGIRGLVSKIVPRCVSGPPPPRFYENDKSDAGSVRRYRIYDEEEQKQDEEEEEENADLEKSTSTIQPPLTQLRRPKKLTITTTPPSKSKSKRWGCF